MGMWKISHVLIGLPEIKLITDQLIPIINQKDLEDVPIRCQCMLMRLMQFNCLAEYLPGKSITVPDALSRSPLPYESHDICENSEFVSYVPASDVMVRKFQQATAEDTLLLRAIDYTVNGWPKCMPATSQMNWNSCTASEHICPCHKVCIIQQPYRDTSIHAVRGTPENSWRTHGCHHMSETCTRNGMVEGNKQWYPENCRIMSTLSDPQASATAWAYDQYTTTKSSLAENRSW